MRTYDVLPMRPLLEFIARETKDLDAQAELLGISNSTMRQWRSRTTVQFHRADRVAVRMGVHLLDIYSYAEYIESIGDKEERERQRKKRTYREKSAVT